MLLMQEANFDFEQVVNYLISKQRYESECFFVHKQVKVRCLIYRDRGIEISDNTGKPHNW